KPVGFSPNGAVSNAKVVFSGFGISSADPKFDDYKYDDAHIDVKGKVVLVFDGNPDNDNPHSLFGRFDLRTKALIAKEHGAIGMLVISREAKFEDDRLTRIGYDQSLGEAALPTFVISRNTAANIIGVKEIELPPVEVLSAAKMTPGVSARVNSRDTSPVVSFKVNLVKKQMDAYNVIGILEGTDRTLRSEAIVIGAHYDHLGHGGQGSLAANSTEIHHGADDNASGTAAIIELARQFAAAKKNRRTIIFIAFSGEEEGLFGSSFYVQNPVFPLDKTVAMINLDMVGRLTDNRLTIGGMGTATKWKQLVEGRNTVGMHIPQHVYAQRFTLQLNEDGFGPSDHASFYGKKVPVLFFFTGTHNDYHKPSDTADKINYDGELKVVNYVAEIAKAIDQNPQRPTYAVAKSPQMGAGRGGFNISLGTIPNYAEATDGLLLDGVRDNSPAAKAGLMAGDKVVKLAGRDIRNVSDYTFVLGEMKAGVEYEIVVLRGTEKLTFKIVPVKR
ncbi:MAG: M20/M25/M40 family metallo-hydrolase, partial [Pyrinomonadaceae bacterium]